MKDRSKFCDSEGCNGNVHSLTSEEINTKRLNFTGIIKTSRQIKKTSYNKHVTAIQVLMLLLKCCFTTAETVG